MVTGCERLVADHGSLIESLRNFTTVRSDFYPELYEHYDANHEHWVEEALEKGEDAGDECEEE